LDEAWEDLARYLVRMRYGFAPSIVWIEHDMQLSWSAIAEGGSCCTTAGSWRADRRTGCRPIRA
jgi:hypothetical protein